MFFRCIIPVNSLKGSFVTTLLAGGMANPGKVKNLLNSEIKDRALNTRSFLIGTASL